MNSANPGKERERRFKIRRVEIALDLLAKGVPPQDINYRIREVEAQIGKTSQDRAQLVIGALDIVKRVDPASPYADNELKVDSWVLFKPGTNHESVGMQVKSSREAVEKFLATLPPNERIMGINAGPFTSDLSIERSFLYQLYQFDGYI